LTTDLPAPQPLQEDQTRFVMMSTFVFKVDELSLPSLQERFGDHLAMGPRNMVRVAWLDTFDWRLHGKGCSLTVERESGRRSLTWRQREQPHPYVLPIDHEVRFARDLPEGFLRTELEPIIEQRALLVMGVARVGRRTARISDERGHTLARLAIEEIAIDGSDAEAGRLLRTVTIVPVAIGDRALERVLGQLREVGICDQPTTDVMTEAAAARGRRPGDYTTKPRLELRPAQRSDEAMRVLLAQLLETMTANVDGVLADIDIEFLHDLRVASRRARSAIGQIKDVLPRPDTDHLAAELRWLGSVTNDCRDLDVALLELDDYRRRLGDDAGAVDDLERLLRRKRKAALRRVRAALRSRKFDELVASWRALISEPADGDEAANAAWPIAELAGAKIVKAYRRMIKRGKRLADPPPAAELHRLRIDAKKLRYLLEFFASLYPEATVARLVKELKSFQDVLGGFNDMEVQRTHLTGLADQLMAEGEADASTVFAIGRLADTLRERQEIYHRDFGDRFAEFSGAASRRLYAKTFSGD
jgi:CHAD domain-containing protein